MVHAVSRNFTIRDTNQIMEQLILRCQGDLNMYIRNEMLMQNHCMEIVHSLGLQLLDTMLPVDDWRTTQGFRTHWVKAQLSVLLVSSQMSPSLHPPQFHPRDPLKKKKKNTHEGGG